MSDRPAENPTSRPARALAADIHFENEGFRRSIKPVLLPLLKLALTLVTLGWLVHTLQTHQLLAQLQQMQPAAVALALGLLPLNLALQYWKWHYLLVHAGLECRPLAAWNSLLAGFPLGLITPGRWGELGRGLFLREFDQTRLVTLAALDKLSSLLANALLGALALVYFAHRGVLPGDWVAPAWLLLGTTIALQLPALLPRCQASLLRAAAKVRRGAAEPAPGHMLQARELFTVWLLSLLFVIVFCLQLVILVRGGIEVSLWQGSAAAAAAFFVKSLLPFAVGDLGIREGAVAFFFDRLGVLPQAAFNASLLLFVINLLLPSVWGLGVMWRHRGGSPAPPFEPGHE